MFQTPVASETSGDLPRGGHQDRQAKPCPAPILLRCTLALNVCASWDTSWVMGTRAHINITMQRHARARARAANLMLCPRTETTVFNLGGGNAQFSSTGEDITDPPSRLRCCRTGQPSADRVPRSPRPYRPPSPALFSGLPLPFLGLTKLISHDDRWILLVNGRWWRRR